MFSYLIPRLSRGARAFGFVWLLVISSAGCDKAKDIAKDVVTDNASLAVDEARLSKAIETRSTAAAESPEFDKAISATIDAVGADPAVAASGEKLFSQLGQDPHLAPAADAIIQSFGQSQELQQLMAEIQAENPGISPEQLGAKVEKRIGLVTEGAAFSKAFDASFDRVLAKPALSGAFNRFGAKVANNLHMQKAIEGALTADVLDAKVAKRLTQLNGGTLPDRDKATDLLLEHAFTEVRLKRFYEDFIGLPATRSHLRVAVTKLLESPRFTSELAKAVKTIIDDPLFQKQALRVMITLLMDNPTEADIRGALDPLLDRPAIETSLAKFIDALMDDPAIAAIGDEALKAIANDAMARAAIEKLLSDW